MGARNIDLLLLNEFSEQFMKKYHCDPRGSPKARIRLLTAIEKARKLLSSNREADISCDCLMEDEDFHKHIKRSDYEEMIGPFL